MPITSVTLNSASFDSATDVFTFNVSWTGNGSLNNDGNLDLVVNYTTPGGDTGSVTVRQLFAPTGNGGVAPFNAVSGTNQTITVTDTNIVPATGDLAELQNLPVGTTFTITPSYNLLATGNQPGVTNDTGELTVACFMPGSLIRTTRGDVAVEALKAGDLVLTADGRAEAVRWVGRSRLSAVFGDALRTLPVRIAAGALGHGLPQRDLLVSPGHAMFVDGILVNAAALVNGSTIRQERDVPPAFTYYHVELAEHALILAEGAATESFVENAEPGRFENADERPGRGEAEMVELPFPRATSARQVPTAIRMRLAAVAAELGGMESKAA